jgi:hypothetical protein
LKEKKLGRGFPNNLKMAGPCFDRRRFFRTAHFIHNQSGVPSHFSLRCHCHKNSVVQVFSSITKNSHINPIVACIDKEWSFLKLRTEFFRVFRENSACSALETNLDRIYSYSTFKADLDNPICLFRAESVASRIIEPNCAQILFAQGPPSSSLARTNEIDLSTDRQ